jgi:hypothetical protein
MGKDPKHREQQTRHDIVSADASQTERSRAAPLLADIHGSDAPAHTAKQRNCPFLNSFIPDAIGTVGVTQLTHIGTVNAKIMAIPTLNPGEKSFHRRIELLSQDLAREYHEA